MLNQCNFIGRATKDCELKYTPSGDAVANFTVAVSEQWKDKNGEKQEITEFVNAVAWRKLGEICGQFIQKGQMVFISGKLQTRSYDDRDGNKRYISEVVVGEMKLLGGKPESRHESRPAERSSRPAQDDYVMPEDLPF